MASGFHVEVDELAEASRGIAHSVSAQDEFELRGLCGEPELYGHSGVHDALMEFCVRWSEGLDHLTDDANAISDTLARAAGAYREVDYSTKQALTTDPALGAVDD